MINDIPILRPTAAEISTKALKNNLQKIKAEVSQKNPDTKVMLLVKANAYGHGIELIAQTAQSQNLCDFFGVASIEEGLILRQNGIKLPILVLGSIYPFECFAYALKNDISVTVASVRAAKYIADLSVKLNLPAKCHIKQETGMSRIGSRRPAAMEVLKILNAAPNITVEGVFSHLSSADSDKEYTLKQIAYFEEFLACAKAEKLNTGLRHLSATGGFLNYPQAYYDMVRIGAAAYGLTEGFEPVLSLKSKVVFIKDVREGAKVSYEGNFVCARPSKIATIPVGYGDGYHRVLSGKAEVLIKGKRCPVIGNITMDMLMADITDLGDIPVGEEAVLIGQSGGQRIKASDLASLAGTIDYEIVTSITARVPRIKI